uniref:Uncharacterized protein n=1 Tax=Chromera velia CCMP2878 TaxID=1169474 RepID=A0A0G4FMC3_9ALVE|eukprot:Cvel_17748.t1-p1 / transcript=Cvel_17748.t1 / gene=Cvel_17748 / organism=Chromera_velia_CCMP2878 / gene_product=hypothetical protein / transcript_product=hypothetical protein / location=Cvel_scaffold1434:19833-20768(-) / protein_length=312 / sequence_SO=supercontig / SO=protein_coding / is_pseudo=false
MGMTDGSPEQWVESDSSTLLAYHTKLRVHLAQPANNSSRVCVGGWSMGGIFTYYLMSWYAARGEDPFECSLVFAGRTFISNLGPSVSSKFKGDRELELSTEELNDYSDFSGLSRSVLFPYGTAVDVGTFNQMNGLFPQAYLDYLDSVLFRHFIEEKVQQTRNNPLPLDVLNAEGLALETDSGTSETPSNILVNLKLASERGFKSNCRTLVLHALLDMIVPPGYFSAAVDLPTPFGRSTNYGVPDPQNLGLSPSILPVFNQTSSHIFNGTSSKPTDEDGVPGGHAFLEESAFLSKLGLVPAIVTRVDGWAPSS